MIRERQLIQVLAALNLALVGACLVFLISSRQDAAVRPAAIVPEPIVPVKQLPSSPKQTSVTNTSPAAYPRSFSWRDVWSEQYGDYLKNLRAAGCPEERVRELVTRDIDEFYVQERSKAAVAYDQEWWRLQPSPETTAALQFLGLAMSQQRTERLRQLLGSGQNAVPAFWRIGPLTGARLGSLSGDVHERVQKILERSHEDSSTAITPQAAARLREDERQQLAAVLSPEELEDFLLRYSNEANRLRNELAPLNLSAEEFRRIFVVVEPLDRRVDLEYGGLNGLSRHQQEQHQRIRLAAMGKILSPERLRLLSGTDL